MNLNDRERAVARFLADGYRLEDHGNGMYAWVRPGCDPIDGGERLPLARQVSALAKKGLCERTNFECRTRWVSIIEGTQECARLFGKPLSGEGHAKT